MHKWNTGVFVKTSTFQQKYSIYGRSQYKYELTVTGENASSAQYWIIYRYADAITLLAEAIVRNGGAYSGGDPNPLALLNQVRTRAGLTAYVATDITDSRDFLDKLLMEHAHELYYEGCRRQDLIRDDAYEAAMKRKCGLGSEKVLPYLQRFTTVCRFHKALLPKGKAS